MPVGRGVTCEEKDLVNVFPQYVTFAIQDGHEKGYAYLHESMSLLKAFITRNYARSGTMNTNVKVYEIYKGAPQLLYDLPKGTVKAESDLWKKKPKDRAVVVDEDDLAAALESIQRSMG